jgi:MFS family permease
MGGALFGLEISNISHAHVLMCNSIFKATCGLENPSHSFYAGLITSCVTIGCFIGTCTSGYVQDRFGRKMTVVIACIIYSAGVVIEFFSNTYPVFIAGRIVVGIGAGWFASTVPLYIAELSPSSIRGRLVTSNQVSPVH